MAGEGVETEEPDVGGCESPSMQPVAGLRARLRVDGLPTPVQDPVVENGTDAADRKAEDEAFNIETGSLCQFEQAGWVPVLRHEKRLGEPEETHEDAPQQTQPHQRVDRKTETHEPWQKRGARPNTPEGTRHHGARDAYWPGIS